MSPHLLRSSTGEFLSTSYVPGFALRVGHAQVGKARQVPSRGFQSGAGSRRAGCETRWQCSPCQLGCQMTGGTGAAVPCSSAADLASQACCDQDPALPGILGTRVQLPGSSPEDGMTRESPVHPYRAGKALNQGMVRETQGPRVGPEPRGLTHLEWFPPKGETRLDKSCG